MGLLDHRPVVEYLAAGHLASQKYGLITTPLTMNGAGSSALNAPGSRG